MAVHVWKQLDCPIDIIAAEEPEADACVAHLNHVCSHLLRPVLVVASREKAFRSKQATDILMRVDVGDIGNVVTLVLEPADHAKIHGRWSTVVEKVPGTDPILPKLTVIEHWGCKGNLVGRTAPVGAAE